jgi:Fe-S-cluster containining protein
VEEPTPAQRLRALYERIPQVACKRKCQSYCIAVVDDGALSVLERERIWSLHGVRPPGPDHACGYLDDVGRCSIYALRPLVCRIWGVLDVPGMRCEYGCKPERYLSPAEGHALMQEVVAIGGGRAAATTLGTREVEQVAGMLRMVIGYAAERAETWEVFRTEGLEGLRGIAGKMQGERESR